MTIIQGLILIIAVAGLGYSIAEAIEEITGVVASKFF